MRMQFATSLKERKKMGSDSESCPKVCGSNSCRGAIKFSTFDRKLCPGVGVGCLAKDTKTHADMVKAIEWIVTGNGDRSWLAKRGDCVNKGHLVDRNHAHFVPQPAT